MVLAPRTPHFVLCEWGITAWLLIRGLFKVWSRYRSLVRCSHTLSISFLGSLVLRLAGIKIRVNTPFAVQFWSTTELHLFQPMYGFAGPKNIGLAENLGLELQGWNTHQILSGNRLHSPLNWLGYKPVKSKRSDSAPKNSVRDDGRRIYEGKQFLGLSLGILLINPSGSFSGSFILIGMQEPSASWNCRPLLSCQDLELYRESWNLDVQSPNKGVLE